MARTALRAGDEIGEGHRRPTCARWAILQAHPRFGDDAENAFGADEQSVGTRAGAGAGQAARLDHAARRDDAQRFDEVVDVRVQRREVAARAGGDPAAERRELERLRKMAQREAVRAQLVLERRTEHAGLNARRARAAIDLEHAIETAEIDADRAAVVAADRRPRHRRRRSSRRRRGSRRRCAAVAQSSSAVTSASLRG